MSEGFRGRLNVISNVMPEFEPKIVAFLCNGCAYRSAEKYFMYIEDQMFLKRESEMLQYYIIEHGRMPKINQEREDLF